MEAFSILLYAAAGIVAAPVFCLVLTRYSSRFPYLATLARNVSYLILAVFAIELCCVYLAGAVKVRAAVGPIYFPVHFVATMLAAPALACVLLLSGSRFSRWWPMVALFAWCLGVFAIFHEYNVTDALYGIDGSGGPYSSSD